MLMRREAVVRQGVGHGLGRWLRRERAEQQHTHGAKDQHGEDNNQEQWAHPPSLAVNDQPVLASCAMTRNT